MADAIIVHRSNPGQDIDALIEVVNELVRQIEVLRDDFINTDTNFQSENPILPIRTDIEDYNIRVNN